MLEWLELPFVQRGIAEVLLLAVGAGLIGTWIVLRGLAFYSHAVGTAAFPGLVLADGLGFAAPLGAFGAALAFAALLAALPRRRPDDRGAETALLLVGMLALGVILASDVFGSSAGIETLLFGSLLLIDGLDLALAAGVSALAALAAVTLGPRWVAAGFSGDGEGDGRSRPLDAVLLALVALAAVASLVAVGALLVAALFVVPAATTRLWVSRMGAWQLATILLCALSGIAGVLLSVELNTPPGATMALLSGALFAISALAATARSAARSGGGRSLRWIGAALAAIGLLALGGCGSDADEPQGPTVVATTPVVADLATRVSGGDAAVVAMLDPGTDPHDYEPRPDDVRALADADLVLAGGGDLDAWIHQALEQSGSSAELVVLADSIPHPLTNDAGELDPHWWHDPRNAADAVGTIAAELAERDATAAAALERRANAYASEIEGLDAAVARCLAQVPAPERKIVTDHEAFDYLARRYGIEIVGAVIPALTSEAQPSAGELAELRSTIEGEHVRVVFPESAADRGLADAIAAQTQAVVGEPLFGDSLGTESAETYLEMLSANAMALAGGMTGEPRPCAGLEAR